MSGMENLELTQTRIIAENDAGYEFGVGLLGRRWVGFALARRDTSEPFLMFFSEVSTEDYQLGLEDRDEAIRLTAALAVDPENYGGVDRWLIDEELRGDPEAYRCPQCGRVGCRGDCFDEPPDGDFPF